MNQELKSQIEKWKSVVSADEPEGEGWLTIEDIMEHTGLSVRSTVSDKIGNLERDGQIEKFRGRRNGKVKTFYRFID